MQAIQFWKMITMDKANLLESLISFLHEQGIPFCVIDGQAVNAYVEPLVSLDLDLVVAVDSLTELEKQLADRILVKRHPHSIHITMQGSDLRVQIQTDERYRGFVERATLRPILGVVLPVAAVEDVLQGKIWAALDPERRGSKQQKDLADIARLIETYPQLVERVPEEIRKQLV
jgi:hypothetical protein